MANDWYCVIGNREYGPLDGKKMRRMARSGQLLESSLVRGGASSQWIEAEQVRGLFPKSDAGSQETKPLLIRTDELTTQSKPRLPSRFAIALATVATLAILVAIGIAFDLGRQSASQIATDHTPPQVVSEAVVPVEISTEETTLDPPSNPVEVAATTVEKEESSAIESVVSLSNPVPQPVAADSISLKPEINNTVSAKQLITQAAESVASVRVEGYVDQNTGAGSGFLIAHNLIVTNYHVIEGGKNITIKFPDGRVCVSRGWLAVDKKKDLALIDCDSGDLKPITLAVERPSKLDEVYAVGTPLSLSGTISNGIISGIRTADFLDLDKELILVQTTAAISPGSSGGPLINERGEAVGVTSLGLKGGQNLNFAVAAEHVNQLIEVAEKDAQPWFKLPLPPLKSIVKLEADTDREAEIERERRLANERAKAAAEAFATAAKEVQKQNILNESLQGELDRIVQRAGDITQALSVIEAEGTALTQRREQVMASGAGLIDHRAAAASQLATLQDQYSFGFIRLQRILAQNQDQARIRSEAAASRQQLSQIESEIFIVRQTLTNIEATLITLDREGRALAQQIGIKATQRDNLTQELNLLRQRYDDMSRPQ